MVGMPARPGSASPGFIARRWPGITRAARDLGAAHLDRRTRASRARRRRGCGRARSRCRARRRSGGGPRPTRASRAPPARSSTSGTRPKPIASSSGSMRERVDRGVGRRGAELLAAHRPRPSLGLRLLGLHGGAAEQQQHAADEQERELRQARHERHGGDRRRRRASARLRLAEDLAGDLAAEVGLAAGAGDDDAGRGRDQQRRDLRRQAVADRQQREGVERLAEMRHALLQHADRRCRRAG